MPGGLLFVDLEDAAQAVHFIHQLSQTDLIGAVAVYAARFGHNSLITLRDQDVLISHRAPGICQDSEVQAHGRKLVVLRVVSRLVPVRDNSAQLLRSFEQKALTPYTLLLFRVECFHTSSPCTVSSKVPPRHRMRRNSGSQLRW